jgi:hypothetical protein
MIRKTLNGPFGKKSWLSMFSMEMTYASEASQSSSAVRKCCATMSSAQAAASMPCLFGQWCPDCGADIFLTHLESEFDAIRKSSVVDSGGPS